MPMCSPPGGSCHGKNRGKMLFGSKFKARIPENIRNRLLNEIIQINYQFQERYLAEHNRIRADFHLRVLAPILDYFWDIGDAHIKQLRRSYLIENIERLIDRKKTRKAIKSLLELNKMVDNEVHSQQVRDIFFLIAPLISYRYRVRISELLQVNLTEK